MILSHKYKFIFIKTKKTAGTSIEIFLSPHCGQDDVVTPIWPHVAPHEARNHQGLWNPMPDIIANRGRNIRGVLRKLLKRKKFYNHIPAEVLRRRVPTEVWNTYFKFCVERNPWDKTVSHYQMVNDRAGGVLTFERYIANRSFCVNYPKYTDRAGNLIVDQVVKYESLTSELAQIFDRLGIPFAGELGVWAKADHRKDRRPYQEIFDETQREVIERSFAPEIQMHGYRF